MSVADSIHHSNYIYNHFKALSLAARPIEVFFRQSKSKPVLDQYQIRSRQGIQRYRPIMSLAHYLCCMHLGSYCTFEEGYTALKQQVKQEQLGNLYRLIKSGASLEEVLELAG